MGHTNITITGSSVKSYRLVGWEPEPDPEEAEEAPPRKVGEAPEAPVQDVLAALANAAKDDVRRTDNKADRIDPTAILKATKELKE